MQAFAMWLIPREDPYWNGPEEPLPVERVGFLQPLEAPGLVLSGHKASGQVKLLQGRSSKSDVDYRDKYNKLVYSSHFPFNIVQRPDVCPWDNALVIRDARRRRSAGRGELIESRILKDGIEIAYGIQYGGLKVSVRSTVIADGEFEGRIHRVIAPEDVDRAMEVVEGSSALGLDGPEDADHTVNESYAIARNRRTWHLIASWMGGGWTGIGSAWDYGAAETSTSNIMTLQMEVNTLWAPLKPGAQVLYSVHYASPKPLSRDELQAGARKLLARIKAPPAAPKPAPKKR
jgi:hypothetical protein